MKVGRFMCASMTALMVSTCVPAAVFAEDISVDLSNLNDDYTIDSNSEGGRYRFTGNTEYSIIIDGAEDVEITIENVSINTDDSPAMELKNGAEVTLILEGKNYLSGGTGDDEAGFAGIRVPTEWDIDDTEYVSKLTIKGSGSLEVFGGNGVENNGSVKEAACGGAGIGSNANDDLGEIIIDGGEITAVGGNQGDENGCGGAGIGGGSIKNKLGETWEWIGKITIDKGTVNATGKDGGAGIGSGGCAWPTAQNSMEININGGDVTATGGDEGAGIGGGVDSDSGEVTITDGTVNATGKDGGAGIGGGKNYPCNDINISGGDITAIAEHGGAGIGGGYGEGVYGKISISGKARVVAVGGNFNSGSAGGYVGGAGIGTGFANPSYYGAKISIDDNTTVYAYSGGYGANAVGFGTPFRASQNAKDEDLNTVIEFGKDISLFASVPDASAAAVPVENINTIKNTEKDPSRTIEVTTTVEDPAMLVYYTLEDSGQYPEEDTDTETTSDDEFTWKYTDDILTVNNTDYNWHTEYMTDANPANWAVISSVPAPKEYTVDFESNGGSDIESQTVEEGGRIKEPDEPIRDGYDFKGWYKDENFEHEWIFSEDIVTEGITLYAKWEKVKDDDDDNHSGGGGYELPEKKQDKKPVENIPELATGDHFAYMAGYPDSTFLPEKNMTRAEVAVMFSRLMTEKINEDRTYVPSFLDVTADKWYYNQVGFMEQFGIITGYQDGTFRPEDPITRAEFVTMAAKFKKLAEIGTVEFTDVDESHWAAVYIAQVYNRGWVSGYPDGTFKPDKNITRAEAVSTINRMLGRNGDRHFIDEHKYEIVNFKDINNAYWAYYDIHEAANAHYYEIDTAENWTELKK